MEITPEIQSAIDAAVNAATNKLEAKNSELVKEVRTLKTAKNDAETAAETAAEEAARKSGDLAELEKRLTKKHEREIEDYQNRLNDRDKRLATLTIDNTISDAITKAGVAKEDVPLVTAFLRNGAEMRDGEAFVGDKPLVDSITAFFKSDVAKRYVVAPTTSGSGANGSVKDTGGRWNTKPTTDADFRELGQLANTNPAAYNAVIDQHGLPQTMKV